MDQIFSALHEAHAPYNKNRNKNSRNSSTTERVIDKRKQ